MLFARKARELGALHPPLDPPFTF